MSRFTLVSKDAFDELQLDAGVILTEFDPANPERPKDEEIVATTTGGISVNCTPSFEDFGTDVDNVPNNMKEFKKLTGWECLLNYSNLTYNEKNTVVTLGAADVSTGNGYRKIVPRRNLKQSDFMDKFWWVGDKANGGAYAVCVLNALSTGGMSIQTSKNGKGTNGTTIMGHVSIDAQDTMPMEFYVIDPAEDNVE